MARSLVEDLEDLMKSASQVTQPVHISTDPNYVRLRELLDALQHSPAMETLSADELRALNTLIITVARSATMTPEAGRAHIAAVWRPAASGVVKLPLGMEIRHTVQELMLQKDK